MTQRTGLGAPAQERPKLLSDQSRGARVVRMVLLVRNAGWAMAPDENLPDVTAE